MTVSPPLVLQRFLPVGLAALLVFLVDVPSLGAAAFAPSGGFENGLLRQAAIEDRDESAAGFVDDTVRFSALVSRIQEVLKQLGIYNGPVDGAYSATTERAIRIYESQVELPITGQPTRELLDHLETVGRANRLLARLGETRERKQQRAREILSTSALAKRLENSETESANPLRDPSPCFSAPSPGCLLDEAFESAKAIADLKFRDWALGDIAVARAGAGLIDDVYRTISLIDDPRLTVAALRDSGIAWAKAGLGDEARGVVDGIHEPMTAAEIIAAIAVDEARSGTPESLGRTLGELMMRAGESSDAPATATLLAKLVPELRAAGAEDAAQALLEVALHTAEDTALSNNERDRVLGEVATVLARGGETGRARLLLARIDDASQRRPALLALAEQSVIVGDSDEAIAAATDVGDTRYRVIALTDVAIAQARVGRIDDARRSIEQAKADTEKIDTRFTYAKAVAVSRIAAALAEIRGFEAATDAASKITDDGLRAQSLWHLASLQARDGQQADKTRSMALDAADKIASDLDRAWTLARLALSSARLDEWTLANETFEAAIKVARGIENGFARASALTKLASTLVALERIPAGR